jgi:hypothetical protein
MTVFERACGVSRIELSHQCGKMLHGKSHTTILPSRQFVTPSVFECRLTSRSRLVRADDHRANAIGLLDLETGDHILVNYGDWLKHNESPRVTAEAV